MNTKPLALFLFVCILLSIQVFVNVIVYNRHILFGEGPSTEEEEAIRLQVHELQRQIQKWKTKIQPSYKDDGNFIAFTIRDSKRLVPTQIPDGFFIFDYIKNPREPSGPSSLYLQGQKIGSDNCIRYNVLCYKSKILQVLNFLYLHYPNASYFFYMESDNDLCVPLHDIRNLTYHYQRYFISTGIGFSGWIMSRQFVKDFFNIYKLHHKSANEAPDPLGAILLMEKCAWSVTRQYLVSHTILPSIGAAALTVGRNTTAGDKHLPRCFEPHRANWPVSSNDTRDMYGWDFFDYDMCPDADIFPCKPGQIESLNITASVNETIMTGVEVQELRKRIRDLTRHQLNYTQQKAAIFQANMKMSGQRRVYEPNRLNKNQEHDLPAVFYHY